MVYALNGRFQLKISEIGGICDGIKMYKASHSIPAWLVYSSACHGLPHRFPTYARIEGKMWKGKDSPSNNVLSEKGLTGNAWCMNI